MNDESKKMNGHEITEDGVDAILDGRDRGAAVKKQWTAMLEDAGPIVKRDLLRPEYIQVAASALSEFFSATPKDVMALVSPAERAAAAWLWCFTNELEPQMNARLAEKFAMEGLLESAQRAVAISERAKEVARAMAEVNHERAEAQHEQEIAQRKAFEAMVGRGIQGRLDALGGLPGGDPQ